MNYSIYIEDKNFVDYLKKNIRELANNIQRAVDNTAAFGLTETKTTLPKRTGNLRRTYLQRKTGAFTREIYSNSQYANALEFGSKAHTITPKRAKWLTIPTKDSVLTSTRSQIKKSSLDNLFSKVGFSKKGTIYSKVRGKTVGDIFDEVGVRLAKKANIPAQRGKFYLRDRVNPKIANKLSSEMDIAIRRTA